jgi:serine/threonine-protein kinase
LDSANEDAAGLVREHFLQEARIAARLSHPSILKIFGIQTKEPQPFVVMEFLEGPSLAELLAESGPLPVERTVRLIGPVAGALEYAHDEGVIHRDLRPGVIIVLAGDQPILTGFLMAKMADVVSAVTRQGLAVGTPGYSSPELVTGGSADRRGDIFSLGVVVYELLTGRQPFIGRNMAETLYRIAHVDPQPPSTLASGLDERHDRLLLRALAKSPEQRQQNMGEFKSELEAWLVPPQESAPDDTDELPLSDPSRPLAALEIEPEPPPMPTPPPAVPVAPDRRAWPAGAPKRLAVAAGVVAVLLVSLLAAWQFGWLGSEPATEKAIEGMPPIAAVEETADAGSAVDDNASAGGEVEATEPNGETAAGEIAAVPEPATESAARSSPGEDAAEPPLETVVAPSLPSGVLEVASLPWARVSLDGMEQGETPLRIDGLAPGEHRLSLSSAGGVQWSGMVTVRGNQSTYYYHNFEEDG